MAVFASFPVHFLCLALDDTVQLQCKFTAFIHNGAVTSDVNTTQSPRRGQSALSKTDPCKDGVGETHRS